MFGTLRNFHFQHCNRTKKNEMLLRRTLLFTYPWNQPFCRWHWHRDYRILSHILIPTVSHDIFQRIPKRNSDLLPIQSWAKENEALYEIYVKFISECFANSYHWIYWAFLEYDWYFVTRNRNIKISLDRESIY